MIIPSDADQNCRIPCNVKNGENVNHWLDAPITVKWSMILKWMDNVVMRKILIIFNSDPQN